MLLTTQDNGKPFPAKPLAITKQIKNESKTTDNKLLSDN